MSEEALALDNEEIGRYSRQMILPEIGYKGQVKLKGSSVLIVGVGGLGSPAAIYLASAGIGKIGLIDYDEVETSNLHRQVIHSEKTLGISKSLSAKMFINSLNSKVQVATFEEAFTRDNALDIISQFDITLDCTDNAATRYLLNDACVLGQKPLISGSALRFDGQLIIYNYQNGPCYRCLFPTPPPPELVTNCSDGGVIGAIPGIIGTLQALEAIKILSGLGGSFGNKMLLFNGLDGSFRNIKLRNKQQSCRVCGENPEIIDLSLDYKLFCGSDFSDKDKGISILNKNERILPKEYKEITENPQEHKNHLLIDVREPHEIDICTISKEAINLPFTKFDKKQSIESLEKIFKEKLKVSTNNEMQVYVVCRRGNDSQRAVKVLKEQFSEVLPIKFYDIKGGLHKWARDVDKNFPVY